MAAPVTGVLAGVRASEKHQIAFDLLKNSIDFSLIDGVVPPYVSDSDPVQEKLMTTKTDKQTIDNIAVDTPLFSYHLQTPGATCLLQQLANDARLSLFIDEVDFWPLIYSTLYDSVRVVGGSTHHRLLYDLTSLAGNGLLSTTNGSHYDVVNHSKKTTSDVSSSHNLTPVLIQFTIFHIPQPEQTYGITHHVNNDCSTATSSPTPHSSTNEIDLGGEGTTDHDQRRSSMTLFNEMKRSTDDVSSVGTRSSRSSVRQPRAPPVHPLKSSTKKSSAHKTKTRDTAGVEQMLSYAEHLFDDDAKTDLVVDGGNRSDGTTETVVPARVFNEKYCQLSNDRTLWDTEKSPDCRQSLDCLQSYLELKRKVWANSRKAINQQGNQLLRRPVISMDDNAVPSTTFHHGQAVNRLLPVPVAHGDAENNVGCRLSCSHAPLMLVKPSCGQRHIPFGPFKDIRLLHQQQRHDQDVASVEAIATQTSSSSTLSDATPSRGGLITASSPEAKRSPTSNLPENNVAEAKKLLPQLAFDARLHVGSNAVTTLNEIISHEDKCLETEYRTTEKKETTQLSKRS